MSAMGEITDQLGTFPSAFLLPSLCSARSENRSVEFHVMLPAKIYVANFPGFLIQSILD